MKDVRKIFCPGAYTRNNKGDAAQLIVAAEEIRSRFPGVELTFATVTPSLDAEKFNEFCCFAKKFLVFSRNQRYNLIGGLTAVLRRLIDDV